MVNKAYFFFFPLLIAVSVSSCAVWKPLPFKKVEKTRPISEIYQHYYDYPDLPLQAEIIKEEKFKKYILRQIEIPLNLPPDLIHEDPSELQKRVEKIAETDQKTAQDMKLLYATRIDYYLPANLKPGEKRPAILISSILGGTMVVKYFAKYYAQRGFVAALIHRKRLYWNENEGMQQTEDYMRTSVIRLREALDWLTQQPEVDPNRIGAFGISYGAVLHALLAAVDTRVKYHILAMPAGQLADLIMECPDKAITKVVKKVREQYGWSDDEIRIRLRRTLVTDPFYLAPYIPKKRLQIYIALFDRVVGAKRSFALWKAMGKPELRILPFGHYGGILVLPYLEWQSYRSFKRHLK